MHSMILGDHFRTPRRGHHEFFASAASSVTSCDEERYTPGNACNVIFTTLFCVVCGSFALSIQLFLLFMFTFAAIMINFAVP